MRIGIPTLWFQRGQAYVSLQIKETFEKAGHEVYIYARHGYIGNKAFLETEGEFKVDKDKFSIYPNYTIPPDVFEVWLTDNKIDVVIFVEEQWQVDSLIKRTKKLNIKTAGCVLTEFFDKNDLKLYIDYDIIICPTKLCFDIINNTSQLKNKAKYIPWGVDLSFFSPASSDEYNKTRDDKVRFFHNAGWGGIHARKNTQSVIDAFLKMKYYKNALLLVHKQTSSNNPTYSKSGNLIIENGNVTRAQIVKKYLYSDISVLPSKWEGLGLPFIESLACGIPVITVDKQPMNEHIKKNKTGWLCSSDESKRYPGIFIDSAEVNINSLSKVMDDIVENKKFIEDYKYDSFCYAQKYLDWNENSKYLIKAVEKLVN